MPQYSSTIDEQIGQCMRTRRTAKGLTQKQLGNEIGVTFQQIQKYEKGIDRVAASRLIEIAKALNVSPLRLLPSVTHDDDSKDNLLLLLDGPVAIRMAKAFKRVCPKWRICLVEIVEACTVRIYPSCDD